MLFSIQILNVRVSANATRDLVPVRSCTTHDHSLTKTNMVVATDHPAQLLQLFVAFIACLNKLKPVAAWKGGNHFKSDSTLWKIIKKITNYA